MKEEEVQIDESDFQSVHDPKDSKIFNGHNPEHSFQGSSAHEGFKSNEETNMTAKLNKSIEGNCLDMSLQTEELDKSTLPSQPLGKSIDTLNVISVSDKPASLKTGDLKQPALPSKTSKAFDTFDSCTASSGSKDTLDRHSVSDISMPPETLIDSDRNKRNNTDTSTVVPKKGAALSEQGIEDKKKKKKNKKKKKKNNTAPNEGNGYENLQKLLEEVQRENWSENNTVEVAKRIQEGSSKTDCICPAVLLTAESKNQEIREKLSEMLPDDSLVLLARMDKALEMKGRNEGMEPNCKIIEKMCPERFKVYFENISKVHKTEKEKDRDEAYLCAFYMLPLALRLRYEHPEVLRKATVNIVFPKPEVIKLWDNRYDRVKLFLLKEKLPVKTVVCIDHQNCKHILKNKADLGSCLKHLHDQGTHIWVFGLKEELNKFKNYEFAELVNCDDTKNSADFDIGAVGYFFSRMNCDILIKIVSGDTGMYDVASQIQKCTVSPNPHPETEKQSELVWDYISAPLQKNQV